VYLNFLPYFEFFDYDILNLERDSLYCFKWNSAVFSIGSIYYSFTTIFDDFGISISYLLTMLNIVMSITLLQMFNFLLFIKVF
jgi:hypothetical protein